MTRHRGPRRPILPTPYPGRGDDLFTVATLIGLGVVALLLLLLLGVDL